MNKLNLVIFTTLLFSSVLFAQQQPAVTVEEIVICTAVENRMPAGVDTLFNKDVGQLYCFTKLNSDQDTTAIKHVWFHNDEQMAEVNLTMKAKSWRTWSSKNIAPDWTGDWRVEVQTASGDVAGQKTFKIK